MAETIVREHESIDEALRRFKRECERAGIMQEIKKREYYESPSMKRKRKLSEIARKDRKQKSKQTFRHRNRQSYAAARQPILSFPT